MNFALFLSGAAEVVFNLCPGGKLGFEMLNLAPKLFRLPQMLVSGGNLGVTANRRIADARCEYCNVIDCPPFHSRILPH